MIRGGGFNFVGCYPLFVGCYPVIPKIHRENMEPPSLTEHIYLFYLFTVLGASTTKTFCFKRCMACMMLLICLYLVCNLHPYFKFVVWALFFGGEYVPHKRHPNGVYADPSSWLSGWCLVMSKWAKDGHFPYLMTSKWATGWGLSTCQLYKFDVARWRISFGIMGFFLHSGYRNPNINIKTG